MELSVPGRSQLLKARTSISPTALLCTRSSRLSFSLSSSPTHKRNLSLEMLSSRAASIDNSGSPATSSSVENGRIGEVERVMKETNVFVKLNVDGTGVADSSTSIPFLDHMLDQLASHGLFDVHVRATGDAHIDDHHTNEDVALAIGSVLLQALGERKGSIDLAISLLLWMKL